MSCKFSENQDEDLRSNRCVLSFVSLSDMQVFFENTLYWYQILNRNPAKLADLERHSRAAIHWLLKNQSSMNRSASSLCSRCR